MSHAERFAGMQRLLYRLTVLSIAFLAMAQSCEKLVPGDGRSGRLLDL